MPSSSPAAALASTAPVDALGYLGGVLLLFGFVLGARLLAASFIDARAR